MLRGTLRRLNTWTTWAQVRPPITIIRSGPRYWSRPERMVQMKKMYFLMGLDQQALRRTAVIQNDRTRLRYCGPRHGSEKTEDPTGFRRARTRQIILWHRRIQYQEFLLQHTFVRETWRVLRKVPVGGAKIDGVVNTPYFGYDRKMVNRYTREPTPAEAKELYPRRKIDFSGRLSAR